MTAHSPARSRSIWWTSTVAGMASFLDSSSIIATGTALVLYEHDLHLSGNSIGALSALLTVCIAIGAFTGGRLGDQYGRRRVFTVTMLLVCTGALVLILAQGTLMLCIGLILLGVGSGADLPVSMSMISESAPENTKGKMVSFSHILWIAGIIAMTVIGVIVGGMGSAGGRILYGSLLLIGLAVLVARSGLPESAEWARANDTRTDSLETIGGRRSAADDLGAFINLFRSRYIVPLIALGLFYALINIAANTGGQFTTYLYVNVAHSTVSLASGLSMGANIVTLIMMFTLMRLVDTRHRMTVFCIGSVLSIVASLVPALFGVQVPTLLVGAILGAIGGAISGEPMYKVWAQEKFPTLHRSSAQGVTIAFTRLVAAAVALFTPAILASGPTNLYWFLTTTTALACVIGIFWVARIRPAGDEIGITTGSITVADPTTTTPERAS